MSPEAGASPAAKRELRPWVKVVLAFAAGVAVAVAAWQWRARADLVADRYDSVADGARGMCEAQWPGADCLAFWLCVRRGLEAAVSPDEILRADEWTLDDAPLGFNRVLDECQTRSATPATGG